MEEPPSVTPTQAPQKAPPPPPSANDVASELLRQGELMKKQSAAMSARAGRNLPVHREPLARSMHSRANVKPQAQDSHKAEATVSGRPSQPINSTAASTQDESSISHARKALHDLTTKELNEESASAVKRALDKQNADQYGAIAAADDDSSMQASDAVLSPTAAANKLLDNDAEHLDKLQHLIDKLHTRVAKESSDPAKVFVAPSTTTTAPPPSGSDRALQIERRSRAGLESFIHGADDIVKEEQFDQIKAEQDEKERVHRREQLKLSLRDLGKRPVNTDISSALDAAMVSESMSMPGSFVLR
jgi:hypothetical protein